MAFIKRTWLARLGQGLNKFFIGEKDSGGKQALTNAPDSITQEGDIISADNLNDLEDRIEDGFNGVIPKLTKVWENPTATWGADSIDLGVVAEKLLIGYSTGTLKTRLQYKYVSSASDLTAKNLTLNNIEIIRVGDPVTSANASFTCRRFGVYTTQTTTIVEFELAEYFIIKSDGTIIYGQNGSPTQLVPQVIYAVGDIYNTEE